MYDLIIIGAGPAGLSAGLYAARAKMNTLIVEKEKLVVKSLLLILLKTIQVELLENLVQA